MAAMVAGFVRKEQSPSSGGCPAALLRLPQSDSAAAHGRLSIALSLIVRLGQSCLWVRPALRRCRSSNAAARAPLSLSREFALVDDCRLHRELGRAGLRLIRLRPLVFANFGNADRFRFGAKRGSDEPLDFRPAAVGISALLRLRVAGASNGKNPGPAQRARTAALTNKFHAPARRARLDSHSTGFCG
jgi:hypothetical protein